LPVGGRDSFRVAPYQDGILAFGPILPKR